MDEYTLCKNPHLEQYLLAAQKLGIQFKTILNGQGAYLFIDNHVVPMYRADFPLNSYASAEFALNKYRTGLILRKQKLPFPAQLKIKTIDELTDFYDQHQEIVVKPLDGEGGEGVTVLPSRTELEYAFYHAQQRSKTVLAESYIKGENYRILVLKDQVLAVAKRKPAAVTGNGKDTIKDLINFVNEELLSKNGKPIHDFNEVNRALALQNLDLNAILPKDETINVLLTSNLSQGGTTEDITEIVHPKYKEIAIEAAKWLGLTLAGIDLITPSITEYIESSAINEVNVSPGMRIHYLDPIGAKKDVAMSIMRYIKNYYQHLS